MAVIIYGSKFESLAEFGKLQVILLLYLIEFGPQNLTKM